MFRIKIDPKTQYACLKKEKLLLFYSRYAKVTCLIHVNEELF